MRSDQFPPAVDAALRAVNAAGFSVAAWQEALAGFCRAIGAEAAVTVPRVAARTTLMLPRSPGLEDYLAEYVDDEWYLRDLRADRGWPQVDAGNPVVLEQDIATPDDHRTQPIYQEFARRHGLLWWAGITFRSLDHQYVVSVFRRPGQEPFSERDRRLFQSVTGHFSGALSMAERLATAVGQGALQALEARAEGGILVDAGGRVIALNGCAERLLGDGLHLVGGSLVAHDPVANKALQALIGQTLRHGPQRDGGLAVRRSLRRPLLVDVLPIPADAGGPFLFAKALVILIDLDARPQPQAATLVRLFGLTPREAALAVRLAAGETIAEAAERLSITRGTARSHLKVLFSKTDTHRQADLVGMLQRAAAGVGASRR